MSIPLQCPHCRSVMRVGDQFGGKAVKCPQCNDVFKVPPARAILVAAAPPSIEEDDEGSIVDQPSSWERANSIADSASKAISTLVTIGLVAFLVCVGFSSPFAGLVLLLVAIYFLPTLIASSRGHQNSAAIFVMNLLLGWTLIGWVMALVWSFTEVRSSS